MKTKWLTCLHSLTHSNLRPPDYNKDQWSQHPDIEIVEDLLAIHKASSQNMTKEETLVEEDISSQEDSEDDDDDDVQEKNNADFVGKNKFNALSIE